MLSIPAVRIAVVMGILGAAGLLVARAPSAHRWLPGFLAVSVIAAFALTALHPSFMLESIVYDAPWGTALLLGAWVALAQSGIVRLRSWWSVVLGAAVLGDAVVAAGLALAEPDDRRRARLVLAASGASLVGPWSGASAIALGWGGPYLAALGVGLAALGFVGGSHAPAFAAPDRAAAMRAAFGVAMLSLITWTFMLGGVPDFGAMGLEALPPFIPGHATVWLGAVSAIAGSLFYEPGVALLAQDTLLHATQVRGDWARMAIQAGLSVGGGLPLLLATNSKITVGLPIWVAQVLLTLGVLAWLSPV